MTIFNDTRKLMPAFAAALALTCAGCNDSGTNNEDGTEASASANASETLPSDLPEGIPLYDGTLYTVSDSEDGEWGFIYTTPDTKVEVVKNLTDAFSKDGWTIKNKLDLGEQGGQVTANNGQYDVRVIYTPNPATRDSATPTMMVSYDVETAE